MSEATSPPEAIAPAAPNAPQVDVSKLDDKNVRQYRHPQERRALIWIIIGMAGILAILWVAQWFFGNLLDYIQNPVVRTLNRWFEPPRLGPLLLLIVIVMWIMDVIGQTTRAWQIVAQAVEITPTTFPALAPIVNDLRKRFDLPRVRVYVSRDAPMAGYTIGVRPPQAIVMNSITVSTMTGDEFKFLIGREMGSIKLGHTLMASLLGNVRMRLPQPFSFLLKFRSVLFGSYNHAQELSCDRIGVVATRDVRPALSTLIKQNMGTFRTAKIDMKTLAPQSQEMSQGARGAVMKAYMVLSPKPYAVARLAELVAWAGEPAPVAPTTPSAPPPPTPAASAAAAAASAAAAAASAAAAAASAAEAAASAAIAARGPQATPSEGPSATSDEGVALVANSEESTLAGVSPTGTPTSPSDQQTSVASTPGLAGGTAADATGGVSAAPPLPSAPADPAVAPASSANEDASPPPGRERTGA